jgi:poly-gamma-glutamate synthesis protein (capsule biosynthesis protein)
VRPRLLVAAILVVGLTAGTLTSTADADDPAPAVPRSFTIVASGDVLLHRPLWAAGQRYARGTGAVYDFRPMFWAVQALVSAADLAICHLETPLAPRGTGPTTYPLYGVPGEIVPALAWAGYDRCSTASNHSLDKGVAGIDTTLGVMDAVGMGHAGTARTPAEAGPSLFDVKGVRVAHLSYTYSFNGLRLPRGEPWRANLIDSGRILADAAAARGAGAEFVIASLHWGYEGSRFVSRYQQMVAAAITQPGGVDLILGHHAHVVQPIGNVNGKWVVYGMGNHISNMGGSTTFSATSQDGALVQVTVSEQPGGGFAAAPPVVQPTWVERRSFVIVPLLAFLADPATTGAWRRLLQASVDRTRRVVGPFVPA